MNKPIFGTIHSKTDALNQTTGMDLVVSTSRGRGIITSNDDGSVLPGADIAELTAEAIRLINSRATEDHHWPVLVYLIGGLPDSVNKVVDFYQGVKYEEVFCTGSPITTAVEVMSTIQASMDSIIQTGAVPIFSTIAPMSFHTWNHVRLEQGKTSHLLHFKEYESMQEIHYQALTYINSAIVDINRIRGWSTPHLASQILQKRGMDRPYRFRHQRLVDGCHPTDYVIGKWKVEMQTTIQTNRSRIVFM